VVVALARDPAPGKAPGLRVAAQGFSYREKEGMAPLQRAHIESMVPITTFLMSGLEGICRTPARWRAKSPHRQGMVFGIGGGR